jgi:hypothetical protein
VQSAQAAARASDIEVQQLERDLHSLENEFATETEPETAESLSVVKAGCERLISRLQENAVQEYTVLEARKLVDGLVNGFKTLLAISELPPESNPTSAKPSTPVLEVPDDDEDLLSHDPNATPTDLPHKSRTLSAKNSAAETPNAKT